MYRERQGDYPLSEKEVIVVEASSLEEARAIAAQEWGISPSDVVINLVEEEKKLFGILGKRLKVEAKPAHPLEIFKAQKMLTELLERMGLNVTLSLEDDNTINISGDDAGIAIGRYGETLRALEHLLNLMVASSAAGAFRVRLDSDGYRSRREESIKRMAVSAAKKAISRNKPVGLQPMSNWERKVVHTTLQSVEGVETRSVGQDPHRRVIVCPKPAREGKEEARSDQGGTR